MNDTNKTTADKDINTAHSNAPKTLYEKKQKLKDKHKKEMALLKEKIKVKENKEKEKKRKLETRKKIIIGGLAKNHMEKNKDSEFESIMSRLMNEYILSDNDRDLFDLNKLSKEEQKIRRKTQSANRKINNETDHIES